MAFIKLNYKSKELGRGDLGAGILPAISLGGREAEPSYRTCYIFCLVTARAGRNSIHILDSVCSVI